jgi:hypothetical protein
VIYSKLLLKCAQSPAPPHRRSSITPKWNLSTPYMLTVIAIVMTIVVALIVLSGLPKP